MQGILNKIEKALERAAEAALRHASGQIVVQRKAGNDPVTQADRELDDILRCCLLSKEEGWLSEETSDDRLRLDKQRVWIVDPLDGTREFIEGIDEWSISVALVENGVPVAAGICNPKRSEYFLGSRQMGVRFNGRQVRASGKNDLQGALILASRTEFRRGLWDDFADGPARVTPMGSVAYKLARVSAGLADATFTLEPKSEWDIAAGVCLVQAAGGFAEATDGKDLCFNRSDIRRPGLMAAGGRLFGPLKEYVKSTQKRIVNER
ncbi:MAG: 3'(2'),5'-bisphosphate nucleotidase CysQ [Sedimentisphaerales bacterium]|nr:3'(2'),5'-bisphosphate nucleotidase CysQ [Sedimentisphaerales bacterium]